MNAVATDLKGQVTALEARMDRRFDSMDRRFDSMERRFLWLIGLQFTTLLALLAAAFGVIARLS